MNEYLKTVIDKMFEFVGAEPDSLDTTSPDWYLTHEWTVERENEFKEWLVDYLYTNSKARKHFMTLPRKNKETLRKVADSFVFNYGWKYKVEVESIGNALVRGEWKDVELIDESRIDTEQRVRVIYRDEQNRCCSAFVIPDEVRKTTSEVN